MSVQVCAPAGKVTVREIASAAGVSVATVSRVLNRPGLVQPDKRDAVQRAVLALDYIPNRHARSLISQRSGAVGLLVPTLANPLFAPTIAAIEQALDEAGQALLIHCYDRDPARQLKQVRHLLERGVDGLILTGTITSPALQALLARTGVPRVVQDAVLAPHEDGATPPAPRVAFDNAGAMAMAVQHLHGPATAPSPCCPAPSTTRPRWPTGSMARCGTSGRWALHCLRLGACSRPITTNAAIRAGAARLLDMPDRPTAVACTGDILALGLVAECGHRGVRVPRDLSVTGCGDTELGQYVEPALTTVHLPWADMGRAAVARLLALVAGQRADDLLVLPHSLVQRNSVRPPRPVVPDDPR